MKISIIKHGIIYDLVDGKLKEVDETIIKPYVEVFIAVYRDKKYMGSVCINEHDFKTMHFKEDLLYFHIFELANKLIKDFNIELNEKELKVLESTKKISLAL